MATAVGTANVNPLSEIATAKATLAQAVTTIRAMLQPLLDVYDADVDFIEAPYSANSAGIDLEEYDHLGELVAIDGSLIEPAFLWTGQTTATVQGKLKYILALASTEAYPERFTCPTAKKASVLLSARY